MANLLWGKVYFKDIFAGYLQQQAGESVSFCYDESYLVQGLPAIAHTLPLQKEPFVTSYGLHPFFDNLVAEGWLFNAQARILGTRTASRMQVLLAFGQDLSGAVSIIDPNPEKFNQQMLNLEDPKEAALLASRASLSGVQPKITLIKKGNKFLPAKINDTSTHIAKFPSFGHDDPIVNEYLTTIALQQLLPKDEVVEISIEEIQGFNDPALIIKRFDRKNHEKIHFEEFNQLLGRSSVDKYDGSYKEMADFIRQHPGCLNLEVYQLYKRIVCGIMLGNTDMHSKNFAMFHDAHGLRLTPIYDSVAAAIYNYKTLALKIGGSPNLHLGKLKANNIIKLGQEFNLSNEVIAVTFDDIGKHVDAAKEAIFKQQIGNVKIKDSIIKSMDARWNGTFALIGKNLYKKR